MKRVTVPVDAIIYIPGEGVPVEIQEIVQSRAEELAKAHLDRVAQSQTNQVVTPATPERALAKMTNSIQGLNASDVNKVVATFLTNLKASRKASVRTLEKHVNDRQASISEMYMASGELEDLITGRIQVVAELKPDYNG